MNQDGLIPDYAIVGAGVSGAYAFWRLSKLGYNVVLFEQCNRIGGRLLTTTPPGMPNLRAELGGMRFLSSQEFVSALVQQLGLRTQTFPMGGPSNIATLRRHLLLDSDFRNPAKVPYFLSQDESGRKPGRILVNAIKTLVPDALQYTPQQWEVAKQTLQWQGAMLYDWGFWDAIFPTMSSEAYALLLDGGGYESLTDNWNAAEACEHLLADFPSNVSYQRLTDGYESLPVTLVNLANNPAGVKLGFMLEGIRLEPATQLPVLEFKLGDPKGPGADVLAKNVLLCLPQMALQSVLAKSSIFKDPDGVNAKVAMVTPMPAIKILMGFSNAWWSQPPLNLTAGRSTTDLPIRQVYYFGTDASTNNALLMAAYSDGRCESFWRFLIDTTLGENELVSDVPLNSALSKEVLRQLALMHGVDVPQPYWMQLIDWTVPPYGAGWHFWNAGIDVTKTIGTIRQPESGTPVYFAGETFSNEQGWVEGALNSAELVLRTAIPDIPVPDWLKGVYLGP